MLHSINWLTAPGDRLQSVGLSRPAEQNAPVHLVDLDIGGRVRGLRGLGRGPRRGIHRHWDYRRAWILQTGGDQAKSRRRCVRDSGNGMGRGYMQINSSFGILCWRRQDALFIKRQLSPRQFYFIGSGRDIEIAGPQKYVTIVWIAHGLNEYCDPSIIGC